MVFLLVPCELVDGVLQHLFALIFCKAMFCKFCDCKQYELYFVSHHKFFVHHATIKSKASQGSVTLGGQKPAVWPAASRLFELYLSDHKSVGVTWFLLIWTVHHYSSSRIPDDWFLMLTELLRKLSFSAR